MINKLKNILFKKEKITNSNEFTNQYLLDKIEEVFTSILKKDSYDDRLLFDCDYIVVLPPDVYKRMEVNSKIIINDIIKRFYKVIKEKKGTKEYIPMAKEWCIQFVPRDFKNTEEANTIPLVEVISSPVPQNWREPKELDFQKVSINGKHSSFSNLNINELLLSNVNMLQKGKGCVKFNPNLVIENMTSHLMDNNEAEESEQGFSCIKFHENGESFIFTMKKNILVIGKGKPNELSTEEYLPIQTEDRGLKPNHLHIKYNEDERGFYIAVIAPTRVNEKSISISPNTHELKWYPLAKTSAILCGRTQFDFEAF